MQTLHTYSLISIDSEQLFILYLKAEYTMTLNNMRTKVEIPFDILLIQKTPWKPDFSLHLLALLGFARP